MGTTGTAETPEDLQATAVSHRRSFFAVFLCHTCAAAIFRLLQPLEGLCCYAISLLHQLFLSTLFLILLFRFFVVFFSVVRLLRHFGLCYGLAPLLSRTISGTFIAYACCSVVPLFHCSSAGGCFLCLDWYFRLPHFSPTPSQLFVCSCWSSSFGAWGSICPVLELGAQFNL